MNHKVQGRSARPGVWTFTDRTMAWATLGSPSPRPSPLGSLGRGRKVHRLSITPAPEFAQLPSAKHQSDACCSLSPSSPREGVRVRGKYSVEHANCSISQGLLSMSPNGAPSHSPTLSRDCGTTLSWRANTTATPTGLWLDSRKGRSLLVIRFRPHEVERGAKGRNPVGVDISFEASTQGRRCAPTLGYASERRWRSTWGVAPCWYGPGLWPASLRATDAPGQCT